MAFNRERLQVEDQDDAQNLLVSDVDVSAATPRDFVPRRPRWRLAAAFGAVGLMLAVITYAYQSHIAHNNAMTQGILGTRNAAMYTRAQIGKAVKLYHRDNHLVGDMAGGAAYADHYPANPPRNHDTCAELAPIEHLPFTHQESYDQMAAFDMVDNDKSGCITPDELWQVMKYSAPTGSYSMAQQAVADIDVCYPHGCVGPVEWMNEQAKMKSSEPPPPPSCDQMFGIMDSNYDGMMSLGELSNAMSSDPSVTHTDIMQTFAYADTNGDGSVGYHEFEKVFCPDSVDPCAAHCPSSCTYIQDITKHECHSCLSCLQSHR